MNYWIFVVTEQGGYTAEEVFKTRMNHKFWGLGERAQNRKKLSENDKVVFYIAIPTKAFGGIATLASPYFKLTNSEKKRHAHGEEFWEVDYGVELKDVEVWPKQKPVGELVSRLKFIENKEYWMTYFQRSLMQIIEDDFKTIIGEKPLVEQIQSATDVENQRDFALESHLEDFIYNNWKEIEWGSSLILDETSEQNGRQFPAGPWYIDFLATDKDTNDLVVIELKKGKTSDATVGQIQAYINWVKENVADTGQSVRGIIIAKEVDDRLRYAIKNLDYLEIKKYKVDFRLYA